MLKGRGIKAKKKYLLLDILVPYITVNNIQFNIKCNAIAQHFVKYTNSLSCRELFE